MKKMKLCILNFFLQYNRQGNLSYFLIHTCSVTHFLLEVLKEYGNRTLFQEEIILRIHYALTE